LLSWTVHGRVVGGHVKSWGTIIASFYAFGGLRLGIGFCSGLLLNIGGGTAYGYIKWQQQKSRRAKHQTDSDNPLSRDTAPNVQLPSVSSLASGVHARHEHHQHRQDASLITSNSEDGNIALNVLHSPTTSAKLGLLASQQSPSTNR
jgi:hypothetical protein